MLRYNRSNFSHHWFPHFLKRTRLSSSHLQHKLGYQPQQSRLFLPESLPLFLLEKPTRIKYRKSGCWSHLFFPAPGTFPKTPHLYFRKLFSLYPTRLSTSNRETQNEVIARYLPRMDSHKTLFVSYFMGFPANSKTPGNDRLLGVLPQKRVIKQKWKLHTP